MGIHEGACSSLYTRVFPWAQNYFIAGPRESEIEVLYCYCGGWLAKGRGTVVTRKKTLRHLRWFS